MKRISIIQGIVLLLLAASWGTQASAEQHADDLILHTRSRPVEVGHEGQPDLVYKTLNWDPTKTAIVICDVWNTMKCQIPADRVAELAAKIDKVAKEARKKGVLVVHSPSGTMDFYAGTKPRNRCVEAPKVETATPLKWNDLNPDREGPLPIDDSDGGWEGPLAPGAAPQNRQHAAIEICEEDAVGDGPDIYYLLEQRGIENVILLGVHTNICVLGRPFGIRQLRYLDKNVLLMRDLTDSLYNPEMDPKVSHYRGTDLVVEHIEKYWCPTITSTDFTKDPPFRFAGDDRKHLAIIVSDDHYHADKTLPQFAQQLREKYDLHCTILHGEGKHRAPLVEALKDADSLIVFVRRLGLPAEQLKAIQDYVNHGKPLIGMRTASHAFKINGKNPPGFKVPEGRAEWVEFDTEVLGGHYTGHGPNELGTDVVFAKGAEGHPILKGVEPDAWHSTGSLYYVSPPLDDAKVLMIGSNTVRTEPLLWTREYHGGKVIYISLGHPDDFREPQFRKLLTNIIFWSMDEKIPD